MALVSNPFHPAHTSRFHALYAPSRPAPSTPPGLLTITPALAAGPAAPARPRRPPLRRGAFSVVTTPRPAPAHNNPFADPASPPPFSPFDDPASPPAFSPFDAPVLVSEPEPAPAVVFRPPPRTSSRLAPAPGASPPRSPPAHSYAAAHAAALEAQRQAQRAERERRARLVAGILFARTLRAGRPRRGSPPGCARPYVCSTLSRVCELEC